jgi:O-acetyl-ADP-ribose deacetylase (regulator of RNase III)
LILAVFSAIHTMRTQAEAERIERIAIPRIGVGYGGLSWKKVRAIVESVFGNWEGTLVVNEEYVAGQSSNVVSSPNKSATARTTPDGKGSDHPRGRSPRKRSPSN